MSTRRLSNKKWLALTSLAIMLVMVLSAGILFAANAPKPPRRGSCANSSGTDC